MKLIKIPEHLKGKELFKFLIENKSLLISQKKAMIKCAEAVSVIPEFINSAPTETTKADGGEEKAVETGVIRVKMVCNTSLFCDSQMDVLLPGAAKKSLKERKGLIPHIHDHNWKIDAHLGDVAKIYYQDVPLKDLGYNSDGTADAIIMESDVRRDYNEKAYRFYKSGKIKQHSIGLQYVMLDLAINDKDSEKEYDFWKKYYNKLINPEAVEDKGYFWVVQEFKLLENSAVLFGSNILTPTLETVDTDGKSTDEQPVTTTTAVQPPAKTEVQPAEVKTIDFEKLAGRLSFHH